jgi:alpha-N-acetylglucosaminidase
MMTTAKQFGLLMATFWVCVATQHSCQGDEPDQAARDLLSRIIPEHADSFVLETIPAVGGCDVFELENRGEQLVVRGSSGVAIASGVNWYLKNVCHCHLSFCGDQLRLPPELPRLSERIRRVTPYRYRYCFNFCAFSYTLAWWDWNQWERMIDWMALHGINMPLSVTGQEAIWQKVYRDFGLTENEIGEFFVGPAYLPFGWMGCIDRWGGPLPQTWIDRHLALQKRIVKRQRSLGMTPLLQGFTGHVPPAMTEKFPETQFKQLPSWCGFPGTMFVDPTEPLFERIGKAFVEEQQRQFGTDHLYASDTFIEMSPPSNDPEFLSAMSRAVLGAMKAGDPEAKWVMQGWLFFNNAKFWQPPQTKALFDAVPDERMVVLDLYCEAAPVWNRTEAFHGKPWIWCIIHNYGGKVSMYGGVPQIAKNLQDARTSPDRGDLSGVGVIMEGFGYNPVVYDFLTDMIWRHDVPAVAPWIESFAHRRYGRELPQTRQAWRLLSETLYRLPGHAGSVVTARPSLNVSSSVPHDASKMATALDQLLACADEMEDVDTYQYDVVHLTRQILGDLTTRTLADVYDAYRAQDREQLSQASQNFVELMNDIDRLLGTRREFLLGRWLADAERWATNDQERRLYEWNARNLITLWGPRDSRLHDYARRQWSGLIRGFYLPRWQQFLKQLDSALASQESLDAAGFEQEVRDWEVAWTHQTDHYPDEPSGDPVATSQELWQKYRESYLAPDKLDSVSLSTGKPTSCSTALAQYLAEYANDGRSRDTNAFWATDINIDQDPWWQVDLEQPTTVGRVVLVSFYGDDRYYGFTIETSLDGKRWKVVSDQRANKSRSTRLGYTCQFDPHQARFVRVKMPTNSANTGRHLVEVMVFGE